MAQQNRRYDRTRFISFEADAWEKTAVNRHLIEERGLDLTEADGEHILPVLALIEPLEWTKLVRNPGPVVLTLVREFYANMNVRTNTSTVRGQKIFFSPEFINMLYETPDLEDAPLQAIIRDPNMCEIGPALCPLGIEWHVDTHGQRDWFPTRNLSTTAKVWILFLSSRLEPNKNIYEIRPRRVAWLYAIMQRYSINIGIVICETMRRCRTKKSVKSLYFGSTITQLINMFGNPITPNFGFIPTSNIEIATLHALGPCVRQIGTPGRRQQGRGEFAAYFDRLEEKIDRLYTHQQQFREELATIRAVQRDHLSCTATILSSCGYDINNVTNALNLANIPTIPPFIFQNMNFNFPAGHENVQPQPVGYQVFNGEVATELAPLPGANGEYAVAPGFVDPGFDGGVDLEMGFEQLVEVTEVAGPSGDMADFRDHTNIFGKNGSSSSSTNKE